MARSPFLERRVIVPVIVACYGSLAAIYYAHTLDARKLSPDPSYLGWDPIRTPGYPAFVSAVKLISPSLAQLGLVQSVCFLLATAFLCYGVTRLSTNRWSPWVLGLGILSVPGFWSWMGQARPEVLFLSLIELFFGASALALTTRRKGWAAAASAALALAILVRPVGYALVLGLVWMAYSLWRQRRVATALML